MAGSWVAEAGHRVWGRLPARCRICRAWPARSFCDDCVGALAQPCPRCERCAQEVPPGIARCGACLRDPPPLDACVAAVAWAWPWSGCLAAFKFQRDPGLAAPIALLMRSAPLAEDLIAQATHLIPMPLAPARLAERGYNQSVLLARALGPARCDAALLLRVRETPSQRGFDRPQRRANVHGAFAVDPLRRSELRDAAVLLIDDVMTSGASLYEAARTLRHAGAARVCALVFARVDD